MVEVVADLDAARHDPRVFAGLAGLGLAEHQALAITDVVLGRGPNLTAILAARQSGKSRALAVAAAWAAMRRPGTRVLVVSASEEAAKRLHREIRDLLAARAFRGSVVDETTSLVTLSNGSWVRCVSASERAIRGWTADVLIIDEAALVGDDLITGAAFPTVAATGGRILLASSAGAAAGFFYDAVMRGRAGSEHVAVHEWSLDQATWISPSTLAAMRESMSELRYASEFENRFAGAGSLYFPPETVRGAVLDVGMPGLVGLGKGEARPWAALDPSGSGADHTALVALLRVPEAGQRVFMFAAAHQWPASAPIVGEGSYVEDVLGSGVPFARLMIEDNGLGKPVHDMIRLRLSKVTRPMTMTAQLKPVLFAHLRMLLERGALVIPAAAEALIRELLLLSVELTPSGTERIAASAGHDDLAMAAALALQPYRLAGGRITTLTSLYADPAYRRSGEISLSAVTGSGDLVETPRGVKLPRRPVLQSIDTGELTLPGDWSDDKPEPERIGRFIINRKA